MSNVMPLPTSTTLGALRAPRAGCVVEADQPRRRRRGPADGQHPAEALIGQLLLVPDRAGQAVLVGQRLGLLGEPLRRLEVGRDRGQHPGAPAGATELEAAFEVGRDVVVDRGEHDPAYGLVLGPLRSASGSRRSPASRRRRRRSAPRRHRRRRRWSPRCRGRRSGAPAPRRPDGSHAGSRRPARRAGRGAASRCRRAHPRGRRRPRRPCLAPGGTRARPAGRSPARRPRPPPRGRGPGCRRRW